MITPSGVIIHFLNCDTFVSVGHVAFSYAVTFACLALWMSALLCASAFLAFAHSSLIAFFGSLTFSCHVSFTCFGKFHFLPGILIGDAFTSVFVTIFQSSMACFCSVCAPGCHLTTHWVSTTCTFSVFNSGLYSRAS